MSDTHVSIRSAQHLYFLTPPFAAFVNVCDFRELTASSKSNRWIPVQLRTNTRRDGLRWNRTWNDYADGFRYETPTGDPTPYLVYWLGLRTLHELTTSMTTTSTTKGWKLVLMMEWEHEPRTASGHIQPPEIVG